MQIRIVAVGKLKERYAVAACAEFAKRIAPYYPLEVVEVRGSIVREEATRIMAALQEGDRVWLLDRQGSQLSSERLAEEIARVAHAGTRRLTFVIAGAYGADPALRERADFVWSLSELTLLHEWARMLVLEQLYRAAKIARNEPYHH
jgi:23S rRNA (pseudouridine1915-N3)-methyltransferase